MNNPLVSVAKWMLFPWQRAALRTFLTELTIAFHHRQGLSQIRHRSLHRPKKLNRGCGPCKKEGFLYVDLLPAADLIIDLRRGVPFESNCCEVIFSEHCFEHF